VKQQIHVSGLETGFHPYPAAVKHAGLVFVSGVRPTGRARSAAVEDMQKERLTKEQGYGLADHDERKVSVDSWATHANLETVLRAAGTSGEQILRQHIWQRDKRFFPCYERVRVHFQATPAPSSGLGVAEVSGNSRHWIGIDAIAVAPGENPNFPARSVVSAVDNRNLPSASHYSQAVRSGDLLFTAGHIAIKTAEPVETITRFWPAVIEAREEAERVARREAAGSEEGEATPPQVYLPNRLLQQNR